MGHRNRIRAVLRGRPRQFLAALSVLALLAVAQFATVRAQAAPVPGGPDWTAGVQRLDTELGDGWWRSGDRMIEATSDSGGYHINLAVGSDGFAWQPLATIRPAGFDTGTWTGYSCLTGSGNHVVAVVAPGYFANSPLLRDRGAFAYVVDVPSGTVRALVGGVALKYYSPGCGAGDSAVLTRHLGTDQVATQLVQVDAGSARVVRTITVAGQLTSAVPDPSGAVLAAYGSRLVRVDASGIRHELAGTPGQIYDIVPGTTATGFLVRHGTDALVYRFATGGKAAATGRAPLAGTRLFAGRSGRSILVARSVRSLGTGTVADQVVTGNLPDRVDAVSLDGQAVAGRAGGKSAGDQIDLRSTRTGRRVSVAADLGARAPATGDLPALAYGLSGTDATPHAATVTPFAAGTPTCAVPRNSLTVQVPQPGRAQVERAVDLAVTGDLRDQRPTNYLNSGLASYTASGSFGKLSLTGGGTVPAQVYLGILAQESNLDQASWHALPGIPANPLIADYYGSGGTVDSIDYSKADCGYGIGQVTTGMKAADTTPYSASDKLKIALDYEANIAAGLRILEGKWNQLAAAHIVANNGDPLFIENWYFAIWAYNTGVQPDAAHGNTTGCTPSPSCADTLGNWGLGWANNPMNPDYPPDRAGFLRETYADAEHPSDWPYQERVFGWIETPQKDFDGNDSYAGAAYQNAGPTGPQLQIPPFPTFCTADNNCDPNDSAKQFCRYADPQTAVYDHCWWHVPASWIPDCPHTCAEQQLTYQPGAADPGVKDPHPADCKSKLPSGTTIVDDSPTPALNIAGCTSMNWSTSGTFSLAYGTDSAGNPLAVIDTHQLGVGFGGHLYFTHNIKSSDTAHRVTGTWKASLPTHLYNVYAHVPSTGGTTSFAHYKVTGADGTAYDRVIDQHASEDEWASVGYFNLGANAKVTLTNVTGDLGEDHDVAFDAIAFVPVSGTFQHHTFDAVSIFGPDQNLDTNTPSVFDTPLRNRQTLYDWATERTLGGPPWDDPSKPRVRGLTQITTCAAGSPNGGCVGAATSAAATRWSQQVQAAGTSTAGSVTEATWMGLSVPRPDPTKAPAFGSDLSYKIKTHVDVTYAVDGSGKVVPGSQSVNVTSRTGDTHLAPFVVDFMQATQTDYGQYGVTAPNLRFVEYDANTYTGDPTTVTNPVQTGYTPGQAYMPHTGSAPIDSTGLCVQTKAVTGGAIGYRALDTEAPTDARVNAWVQQLRAGVAAGHIPPEVADTAGDIYSLFFRGQGNLPPSGSLFNVAPPIWHNLKMKFCSNGTIKSTQTVANSDDGNKTAPVYQSYMPDLYLYLDGHLVDDSGKTTTGPVQHGNFLGFSNIPSPLHPTDNPYAVCDVSLRGNGGNPWNIAVPPLTPGNFDPHTVWFCDDGSSFDDTYAP